MDVVTIVAVTEPPSVNEAETATAYVEKIRKKDSLDYHFINA